jgi:hypothetical protein
VVGAGDDPADAGGGGLRVIGRAALKGLWTRAAAAQRRLRGLSPRRRDAAGLSTAVVVWVAVLLLVATAGKAVVVQRVDRSSPALASGTTPTPTTTPVTIPDVGSFPVGAVAAPPLFTSPELTAPPRPFDLGVSNPLKSAPAAASLLPALPVITLPPLPPALAPLLSVTSPSVREICSATGVAVVVAGLVKGDLEPYGIPVTQALTYLGPVLAVCALFPPSQPSICAVDTALNNAVVPKDLQILVGVPGLAGLALDQVASVEALLRSTGLPLPTNITQELATAMGCQLK